MAIRYHQGIDFGQSTIRATVDQKSATNLLSIGESACFQLRSCSILLSKGEQKDQRASRGKGRTVWLERLRAPTIRDLEIRGLSGDRFSSTV